MLLHLHSHTHARHGVLNPMEAVPVHRYIRIVVPGRVTIVHVLAFEVSMAQGLAGEALVHKVSRRGRKQVWWWRHDCGAALLWRGGDSVRAVWVGKGLNELVRRRKEDRKTAIAGGVLGTGNPIISARSG